MTQYREFPNALHLAGLACFKCKEPDVCTIVCAPRGLFIATCSKCRYTTRASRKTYDLLAMYAFGDMPVESERQDPFVKRHEAKAREVEK